MSVTFLEPGGDATFNVATTTAGGFWSTASGATVATDFVHGTHIKSIKYRPNTGDIVRTPTGVVSDAGARVSIYIYLSALPTLTKGILAIVDSIGSNVIIYLNITSAGTLQISDQNGTQIGTNGDTLSTGVWYRISLAYTVTDSTHNRFELFVNGASSISITNGTLLVTSSSKVLIGNPNTDTTLDFRSSDHYIDNDSSLKDMGNIWVTAKRPFSNGTLNNFSTQIGSGGSSYGSGHSPQVNERVLSTTNGWSMIGAGSAVTEEYSIEGKTVGDIDISETSIVDYMGWVYSSSLVSETGQIIVNGTNSNVSLTSTNTMFTQAAGVTIYPVGGADIGLITSTTVTTVSLYECGVMVAFLMPPGVFGNYDPYLKVGGGMSRNERAT